MCSRRFVGAVAVILLAAAMTSCGTGKTPEPTIDANAIYTSAANTLAAGMNARETETAKAVPSATPLASPTPLATFSIATSSVPFAITPFSGGGLTPGAGTTPLPLSTQSTGGGTGGTGNTAVGCNNSAYLSETAPTDKTQIAAGKNFQKGWSMQNTGTCAWGSGYSWAFVSGDQMGGKDVLITSKDTATDPGHSNTFFVKLTAPQTSGEYKGFWQMKAPDGTLFGVQPWVDIVVP